MMGVQEGLGFVIENTKKVLGMMQNECFEKCPYFTVKHMHKKRKKMVDGGY